MYENKSVKGTRKGIKPPQSGDKLVNVTNGEEIRRVKRSIAVTLVTSGWKYCPKKFKLENHNESPL
jgi:hypothetical protein